jgi:hypothetical protein
MTDGEFGLGHVFEQEGKKRVAFRPRQLVDAGGETGIDEERLVTWEPGGSCRSSRQVSAVPLNPAPMTTIRP